MALTDNPMSLVILENTIISANIETDALASGNLDLKVGDYYNQTELGDDIEFLNLYGYYPEYINPGSISNNTTGLNIRGIFVQDLWYELGVGGDNYTGADVQFIGNYSGHTVTIYNSLTNAVIFPTTTLNYYTSLGWSYAESTTAAMIDLFMTSAGKTLSLKIVIK